MTFIKKILRENPSQRFPSVQANLLVWICVVFSSSASSIGFHYDVFSLLTALQSIKDTTYSSQRALMQPQRWRFGTRRLYNHGFCSQLVFSRHTTTKSKSSPRRCVFWPAVASHGAPRSMSLLLGVPDTIICPALLFLLHHYEITAAEDN